MIYVNDAMGTDPTNADAFLQVYYPENELQKKFAELIRGDDRLNQLVTLVRHRFDGELFPSAAFSTAPSPPATMLSVDGPRATARTTDANGADIDLQFVLIGDTWRVSGFTFEHAYANSEMSSAEASAGLDDILAIMRAAAGEAAAMTARIEAGEFATLDAARAAFRPGR